MVYSHIRDGGEEVDLWTDGFYDMAKQRILDTANHITPTNTLDDVITKCSDIHNGNIPRELLNILQ